MKTIEVLKALRKYIKEIYEVIYNLKRDKEDDVLKELVIQVYKNRTELKKCIKKESFIRDKTIYSLVINLTKEERKSLLEKLNMFNDVDIENVEDVYKVVKSNYHNLILNKELKVPIDLEETIEKYVYDIINERNKSCAKYMIFLIMIVLFTGFIA